MDIDIQAKIAQRLAELPPDVRHAIESASWEPKIREIGQRHALHIDQMGLLEDETLLVMLGFAGTDEFAPQIAEQLHIPPEKAQVLAAEVNTEIFLPIRESMKRFMEARHSAQPTVTPDVSTPQPPETTPIQPSAVEKVEKPVDMHAETILTQPTASVAPAPKPQEKPIIKVDPYREPAE